MRKVEESNSFDLAPATTPSSNHQPFPIRCFGVYWSEHPECNAQPAKGRISIPSRFSLNSRKQNQSSRLIGLLVQHTWRTTSGPSQWFNAVWHLLNWNLARGSWSRWRRMIKQQVDGTILIPNANEDGFVSQSHSTDLEDQHCRMNFSSLASLWIKAEILCINKEQKKKNKKKPTPNKK